MNKQSEPTESPQRPAGGHSGGGGKPPQADVVVVRIKKSYLQMALFVLVALFAFEAGYLLRPVLALPSFAAAAPTATPRTIATVVVGAPTKAAATVQATPTRAAVEVGDAPAKGPADAAITIVEFSDFQCPYCKRFRDQTLDQLLKAYEGKVRFAYREFPVSSIHPQAQKASEAALCAKAQDKYWPMHDALYATQTEWSGSATAVAFFKAKAVELGLDASKFDACLDGGQTALAVSNDLKAGSSYGVTGTPTFFINGRPLVGAQPLANFQAVIDAELASLGR